MFNLRLNWEAWRLGYKEPNSEIAKMVSEIIERTVEPGHKIVAAEKQLESMFRISDVSCLQTYGFELRRPDVQPTALEKFLRQRMRHYELDLPHNPLFSDPLGQWPLAVI